MAAERTDIPTPFSSHCGPNGSSLTETSSSTECLFASVTTHNSTDNSSREWPLIGSDINYAARIFFIIIGGLEVCSGIFGNCLLLTVLFKRSSLRLRCVHNFFIASLAISDLISLGYWMTFHVLDLILGYHPVASMTHCRINGFIIGVFYLAGTLSLLSISFNRYLHVCHFHLYSRFFSLPRTVTWCGMLYLTGVVFALPPLVGVGSYTYNTVTHFCSFSRTDHNKYAKITVLMFSVVPWCFVGYWNFAIFRYWRQAKSSLKSNYPILEVGGEGGEKENRRNLSTKLKIRLTRKKSTTREQLRQSSEKQTQISGNPEALSGVYGTDDNDLNQETETSAGNFDTALSSEPDMTTKRCDTMNDCPSSKVTVVSPEIIGFGFDSTQEFNPLVNSTGGCIHKEVKEQSSVENSTVETTPNQFSETEEEKTALDDSQRLKESIANAERIRFSDELKTSDKTKVLGSSSASVVPRSTVRVPTASDVGPRVLCLQGSETPATPCDQCSEAPVPVHSGASAGAEVKETSDDTTGERVQFLKLAKSTNLKPNLNPPMHASTATVNDADDCKQKEVKSSFGRKYSSYSASTRSVHKPGTYLQQLHRRHEKKRAKEEAFVRSLFIVFLLIVFSFIPYGVLLAISALTPLPPEVGIASDLILFLNNALNWIVYGVLNPSFRRGYAKTLKRVFRVCRGNKALLDGNLSGSLSSLKTLSTQKLNADAGDSEFVHEERRCHTIG